MSYFDQILAQHYTSLPTGWRTMRAKFVIDVQTSNVDKVPVDGEESVRLCNYTDVYYNDRITADLPFMEATATAKEVERFTLKAGQVLITKDSESWDDIGIPALVLEDIQGTLCGYHLAIYTPDAEFIDGTFLAWLCRANALNDQFKLSANGVTRFGLGQYALKNAVVGFPPLFLQRLIADFLNKKTTQIDALIEKKQQLLQRLAEKRQAIITQAVTKGLNPSAPMKDSGIQWIGQIPAHWNAWSLKRVVATSTYGVSASLEQSGEVAILRMGNLQDGELDFADLRYLEEVEPGLMIRHRDVIFNRTNSLDLVGKTAIFRGNYEGQLSLASYLVLFRFDDRYDPDFATYAMNAEPLLSFARTLALPSIGQANLNPSRYSAISFPIPPFAEQLHIAAYIAEQLAGLSASESSIKCSVKRLTEYRSALITAAVTGQIKELC
jgi:type I restriction enzyme, S subunit